MMFNTHVANLTQTGFPESIIAFPHALSKRIFQLNRTQATS
ncbi:hypothetical protein EDO6_02791 [Paenibacillus xylanexedens]|nr:hypothetical protein EDO6_02791 [Paenibacillus xylanexedens]